MEYVSILSPQEKHHTKNRRIFDPAVSKVGWERIFKNQSVYFISSLISTFEEFSDACN